MLRHLLVRSGRHVLPVAPKTSHTSIHPGTVLSRMRNAQTRRHQSTNNNYYDSLGAAARRPHTVALKRIQREHSIGRQKAIEASDKFRRWRRNHTFMFVAGGGVAGALAMGFGLYLYLDSNPSAVEKLIVNKAVRAFAQALSFQHRKTIYYSLPEPSFPIPQPGGVTDTTVSSEEQPSGQGVLMRWAEAFTKVMIKAQSPWMLAANSLREELLAEIQTFESLHKRLTSLGEVLPASVERNTMLEDELENKLGSEEWVSASYLNRCTLQSPAEAHGMVTKLLIAAIAYFPGPVNQMISMLLGRLSQEELIENLSRLALAGDSSSNRTTTTDADTQAKLENAVNTVKVLFDSLVPTMKDHVLNTALTTTISELGNLPIVGGVRPYDLYVKAIQEDLLGPLRRDARITDDILTQVEHIFLKLPSDLQARILLCALAHPDAHGDGTPEQQAQVIRDLLSAGGVVAVKLAQMLAEDPNVPENYRNLLGSLRDDNEPMGLAAFWWSIPEMVRKQITHLGPCLGTGSVKQVHKVRMQDGKEYAVAVLRLGVEEEALSSLSALEVSEDVGVVASRLGRLVYGEFSLFNEGEVLEEFALTPIGKHPRFRVVKVRHHSPKCLVEEIAQGHTVAYLLEHGSKEEKEEAKQILAEYHKAVFDAFVQDGLIHSDIHLGNAVVTVHADNGLKGFTLFDIGQFDRIGYAETMAILWTFASVSSVKMRRVLRSTAMSHMCSVSSLMEKYQDPIHVYTSKETPTDNERQVLRHRLEDAYDEAIAPFQDGTLPSEKQAYMLFLRAAERRGVNLPKGAFPVAKLVDGIVSQQRAYDLPKVVDDAMTAFLSKNMSWVEGASIAYTQLSDSVYRKGTKDEEIG